MTKACLRYSLFRNTKRYAGGGLFSSNMIEFDDLELLGTYIFSYIVLRFDLTVYLKVIGYFS